MACQGYFSTEKKKVTIPAHMLDETDRNNIKQRMATVEDARQRFGREMKQTRILDEDGYRLNKDDPISHHSTNCNISLIFAYKNPREIVENDLHEAAQIVLGDLKVKRVVVFFHQIPGIPVQFAFDIFEKTFGAE